MLRIKLDLIVYRRPFSVHIPLIPEAFAVTWKSVTHVIVAGSQFWQQLTVVLGTLEL